MDLMSYLFQSLIKSEMKGNPKANEEQKWCTKRERSGKFRLNSGVWVKIGVYLEVTK